MRNREHVLDRWRRLWWSMIVRALYGEPIKIPVRAQFVRKVILIGLTVGMLCVSPGADAAGLKNVQHPTEVINGTERSQAVGITEVSVPQSLLISGGDNNAASIAGSWCTYEFSTPSEVLAMRYKKEGNVTFVSHVIEFHDGVFVQGGLSKLAEIAPTRNIVLPVSVDTSKSIVNINISMNGDVGTDGVLVRDALVTAELVDSNTVTLTRSAGTSSPALDISWQVIEFEEDVQVQRGTTTFVGSTTATQGITAVVDGKAFVMVTARASASNENNIK